ncbi:hypothetical protein BTW00_02205 [Psychrobacter sp. C 20.9]|uniref:hypothetical protein n=1 Tax=Psychrobacter sp. C 20.9 TaxID=1926477 RepID=UPI000946AF31|nr:hypothetical protein [Psychrobacter sp. C 20.9]OLF37993.1 hypothetical protein BTW00_02205 [Psychrobacter sp. C 20.9]
MGRQTPVVRKPFMIIGGHAENSRDGEIIYQDCFYGQSWPKDSRLLLPEPSCALPKPMDMDYLSRYGTAVYAENESAYRLFIADSVTMHSVSEHPWTYGAKDEWRYWFYRNAYDLAYKERYTSDEIWQRLHEFYKSLDE